MSKKYIYWKWGNGGIMAKSVRTKNIDMKNKDSEDVTMISRRIIDREQNTRELNSERLSQREMIIQTSCNPFLAANDYITDLGIQDEFLRPKGQRRHQRKGDVNIKETST